MNLEDNLIKQATGAKKSDIEKIRKEIEELEVKSKQIEDKINHLKIDEEEWGQLLEFLCFLP